MAITTVDGALAGMQPLRSFGKAATGTLGAGRPFSLWSLAGVPGPGGYDSTLNGVTLSSPQNGQIPFTNPGSGNTYLTRFVAACTQVSTLILADRIWHNGGFTITSTSAQNITSPTWPARDTSGATSGDAILLGMEISSAAGAAAPTITVSYTNEANTSGRTGTNWFATANSPGAGSFFPIGLQAGDKGVRSVQSVTLSASWVSGTMNLVAYRELARLELPVASAGNALDLLQSGFVRMYNDSVPFLILVPSTTTSSNVFGAVGWTQG